MEEIDETENTTNMHRSTDQSELENLRIALEEIFGEDTILHAYKLIEETVAKEGFDFDE